MALAVALRIDSGARAEEGRPYIGMRRWRFVPG